MGFVITTAVAEAAAQRFWAKVAKGGLCDCWAWTAETRRGYGRLRVGPKKGRKNVGAHRLSYVLHHGEIPDGLHVRHSCDNPLCVNSAHLLLGTHTQNMADKVRRGRMPDQKGEHNPFSKLNNETVRQIRELLAQGHISQNSIAKLFGVAGQTINYIATGKTWRHVA